MNEDSETSCSKANMYCGLKFAQIIKATYHKSHKNENSYSYDFSAATDVSLSVFFIKTWQTSSPFLSESWVQIEDLSRVDFNENFHYFYFCQNMAIHKLFKHLLKVVTEYIKKKKRGHGFINRLEILVCFLLNLQGMIPTVPTY